MKNLVITKKRKKYQVTVNDTGPLYAYRTGLAYLLFISDGYYNGGYRLTYNFTELHIGRKHYCNAFWLCKESPAFAFMLDRKQDVYYADFRFELTDNYVKRYRKYFLYGE